MAENISGLVYHAILNNFFTKLKNTVLPMPLTTDTESFAVNTGFSLPDSFHKLLENCVDEVFNSFPSFIPDGKARMSALTARLLRAGKKDFQYHLENCLAGFLSRFAGCLVTGSESYYQAQRDTYIMKGFVDCILKDTSDKYIIIDFKLKHMPSRADCVGSFDENSAEEEKPLADFQLPMYITLTEENENFKVYTALFYSIIDFKDEVIFADDKIARESEWYNKIFEEFNNKTEQFAREIAAGNFSIFAGNSAANIKNNSGCYDCEYQRICRTVYIIDRENNLLGKY